MGTCFSLFVLCVPGAKRSRPESREELVDHVNLLPQNRDRSPLAEPEAPEEDEDRPPPVIVIPPPNVQNIPMQVVTIDFGGSDDEEEVVEDNIEPEDALHVSRENIVDESDSSSDNSINSLVADNRKKTTERPLTARTKRFYERKEKQANIKKSGVENWEKHKKQRRLYRLSKVHRWLNSVYWKRPAGPFPPLIAAEGIDKNQLITLSKVIHDATQKTDKPSNFDYNTESDRSPYCMVHQTNEQEIMTIWGSYRLNPWLKATRDVDSVGYMVTNPNISYRICEYISRECLRRLFVNNRKFYYLTHEEAYKIAHNQDVEGIKREMGLAACLRAEQANVVRVNMLPVIRTFEPIVGIPWKRYFRDVADLPEVSIELLQRMNKYLRTYGVQCIDIRVRVEEVVGKPPGIMEEEDVGCQACNIILNCLATLEEIKRTAEYFVVYGFTLYTFPFRFIQAIVRFTPGIPYSIVNWKNDGVTRPEVNEPKPPSWKFDNLVWATTPEQYRRLEAVGTELAL